MISTHDKKLLKEKQFPWTLDIFEVAESIY